MPAIKDIIKAFEQWAPPILALPDDRIGLQIGDANKEVRSVLVGLDPTLRLAARAKQLKANLVITHHPLFLDPVTALTGLTAKITKAFLRNDIALYVAHTNLDVAPGGVNDALAEKVGLTDTAVLIPTYVEQLVKLAVFVPQQNLEQVRIAICNAGAGYIGKYDNCAFMTSGIGTFRPLKGTNPHIGRLGRVERVGEGRLETIIPEHLLPQVIAAMHKVHPYEEVAYDVYPLKNPCTESNRGKGRILGLGRYGDLPRHRRGLPKTTTLEAFTKAVQKNLRSENIFFTGKPNKKIKRVAVFSGSCSMPLEPFADKVDVLVCGEMKYHKRLEAEELGLAVIIAGHYETEAVVIPKVIEYLRTKIKLKISAG